MEKISRRDINKRKVVQSALELFITNGIENSNVKDIAHKVGLTERSAFRYFPTKADLVLAAAMLFWEYVEASVESNLNTKYTSNTTGIEKIRYTLNEYLQLFYQKKNEIIFVGEAETFLNRCNMGSFMVKPPLPLHESQGPLANAIRDGINDNTIKNRKDLEIIYYNTYDSTLGFIQKLALDPRVFEKGDIKARFKLFLDMQVSIYANKDNI